VRKFLRYSGLGVFFSVIFTFIQGCTQTDGLGLVLLLLLLLLTGASADLNVDGTGSGTIVASTPININCTISGGSASGTCSDHVQLGTTQTLTATPASGFDFDSWSNCSNPSGNVCNHGMTKEVTISANFVQVFTLTVLFENVTSPPDNVVSNIGGINCTASAFIIGIGSGVGVCSVTFPAGTVVALTSSGDDWNHWENCSNSFDRTINVTMNANRTCTATYVV